MAKRGKSLEKLSRGKVRNEYGVEFTANEQKKLKSLVDSANRKAKRLREEQNKLPYFIAGQDTGFKIGDIPSFMGRENDFVLSKKSKSLQRFKSKKEYDRYVKQLKKVVKEDYIKKRVGLYKENHIQALKNAFGGDSKDLVKQIKKMSTKDYLKMIQSDETLSIKYIDSDQDEEEFSEMYGYQRTEQLQYIKNAFENITKKKV